MGDVLEQQDVAEAARQGGPVRERILTAAGFLFYQHGYRAVGIDRVVAEAGVAKATFYKCYGSKDALIVAWIERCAATLRDAASPADGPRPLTEWGLSAIRRAQRDWAMGCAFQTAAAEFSDPHHPVHAAAAHVKRRMIAGLATRAEAEGLDAPEAAAEAVFLFVEGVLASVRMFGARAPLAHAPAALCRLTGAPLA
ncbi:TetR/AcrR family transcriptional regulator [Pseudoroseicyclus tamaricis]|uniref:TetR/AcrR family transcriptional regulator n=1 Tax=Pseudoroseicyclus tamaricis TaxID=2705421 RepID=A0A6B2JXQ5_9RHOB|nr:TetR/AcrR family transcriptional regulator [Pseudoroseicyclus tamaricis]NDV01389.1 TetR/AcrR family transcriptional regulator [Pseudoroseicyclus tamaricis]